MKITIPLLGIIILIFIVHTILTHLLNWTIRRDYNFNPNDAGLSIVLVLMELIVCISLLIYYI